MRPWDPDKAGGPQAPFNPTTGDRYRGINALILGVDFRAFETGGPRWMTYQQAQERSGAYSQECRATSGTTEISSNLRFPSPEFP